MNNKPKIYIAGTGMVTPVGANTEMTAAAVRAGISGYQSTDYFTQNTQQPITMTRVPRDYLDAMQVIIDEGSHYNGQCDSIIKMAILALREAVSEQVFTQPVPLVLAMPERIPHVPYIEPEALLTNLFNQSDLPLRADLVHYIRTGRAAGIQGLTIAEQYLLERGEDYVLLGGSDSYWAYPRLRELDEMQRVLTPLSQDGFAPGEGAGFILLTRHLEQAMTHDNNVISLSSAGSSEESGHMLSELPYQGDGLDQAFKQTLQGYADEVIHSIYSSMNGENYGAKEYGVAYLRNKANFHEQVKIEHPADSYGDLGAATSPVLIALAAKNLLKQPDAKTYMVYSSSDGPSRAAVCVEKSARIANI